MTYKPTNYYFIMTTLSATLGTYTGYYKAVNYGSSSDYIYPKETLFIYDGSTYDYMYFVAS